MTFCACGCGQPIRESKWSKHSGFTRGQHYNKFYGVPKIRGKNHYHWKGGKSIQNGGYILVLAREHPNCHKNGCMLEHILVMEKHLGRYLREDEIVHHINGIRSDNRIENLEVMTRGQHMKHHIAKIITGRWPIHHKVSDYPQ